MNLALSIARRYLVGKKTTQAINLITGISVVGISVGTCALILILSVFNGFQGLIYQLFNSFNPDLKITPVTGKTFVPDSSTIANLRAMDGVLYVSETLEETALFEYKKASDAGKLKGVDTFYRHVTLIDSVLVQGADRLNDSLGNYAILGAGIESAIGANIQDAFNPITVYMPRKTRSSLDRSFETKFIYPSGIFSLQQDYDKELVIAPLPLVRSLLGYHHEVSYLEIRLDPSMDPALTQSRIQQEVGPDYQVQNKLEQQSAFLRLMNIEKWVAFAILSLAMLLVIVNLIGALWMIVLDKRQDISQLKAMGAPSRLVRDVFLYLGFLLGGIGLVSGFILALVIYGLQIRYKLLSMGEGFIVDAYPIQLLAVDFIATTIIVMLVVGLASILPALRADRVGAYLREE
ncbi:MAG: FtsX-like permease family protein [Saprospiraceae bacterium]|nr:FtsX-like permease family protein [Saprospiraceae bacterium]